MGSLDLFQWHSFHQTYQFVKLSQVMTSCHVYKTGIRAYKNEYELIKFHQYILEISDESVVWKIQLAEKKILVLAVIILIDSHLTFKTIHPTIITIIRTSPHVIMAI